MVTIINTVKQLAVNCGHSHYVTKLGGPPITRQGLSVAENHTLIAKVCVSRPC